MEQEGSGPDVELFLLFKRFDTNDDGLLDEREFGEILEHLGWDSPPALRSLEFAAIDPDGDGLLEFQDFADWWLDQN